MIISTFGISMDLPCYPDEINDATSVNWSETGIIGRSTPIYSYNNTSPRSVAFSFDLHREMPISTGETNRNNLYDIEGILRTIRKCAYPNYTNSGVNPPVVVFRFGEFKTKGIVTNVGFTWKKPIKNRKYQLCTVSISLFETPNMVYSASELLSSMNPFNVSM